MKKSKTVTLNSGTIISIRKSLDIEITKAWNTIKHENIMSTKEIKEGLGSGKDLKALYNSILQMQQKRIKIKGMLFALNTGSTNFDFKEFSKTNNYTIFAACEVKETIAHLKAIPTLNPVLKAKKGASGTGKKELFASSAKIASLLKELQLKANKYDAELEKFNNETSLTFTDDSGEFDKYLTA